METLKLHMPVVTALCALVLSGVSAAPAQSAEGGADLATLQQQMHRRLSEAIATTERDFGVKVNPYRASLVDLGTGRQYSLARGLSAANITTRPQIPEPQPGRATTTAEDGLCCVGGGLCGPFRRVVSKSGYSYAHALRTLPPAGGILGVDTVLAEQPENEWNECVDLYHGIWGTFGDTESGLHYYGYPVGGPPQREWKWQAFFTWQDWTQEPLPDEDPYTDELPPKKMVHYSEWPQDGVPPSTAIVMEEWVQRDGQIAHQFVYYANGNWDSWLFYCDWPRDHPWPLPRKDGVAERMRRVSNLILHEKDEDKGLFQGDGVCGVGMPYGCYGLMHQEAVTDGRLGRFFCSPSACFWYGWEWTEDRTAYAVNVPDDGWWRTRPYKDPDCGKLDFLTVGETSRYSEETISLRAYCNADRYPLDCASGARCSPFKHCTECPWPFDVAECSCTPCQDEHPDQLNYCPCGCE